MKERFFYIIVNILVFLISATWVYFAYYIANKTSIDNFNNIIITLWLLITLQWLLIIYLINNFFYKPLNKLEYIIKSFIIWNLKDKDIFLKDTLNPNINYIFKFFSRTLNTLRHIKDEFLHGKEIKWEVELWKEIQSKMLDKKLIDIPSLNIIAKSKPAAEIWWDSYDIIKQWDNYYIYVWDATGHWVWAWLIMIMVNSLVSWFSKVFKSWAQIITNTNEILKPRIKANLLMSLLLLRWNENEKRLFMTWAGHEYLIIYKHSKNKCFKIKSGWVALWMVKDVSNVVKEREILFEENDIVILYSDWITEAINQPTKNWNEEMFWEDRLIDAIEKTPKKEWKNHISASSVFNNISIELSKFMGYKYSQLDDITLCVMQYKWKDSEEDEWIYKEINEDFITEWNW